MNRIKRNDVVSVISGNEKGKTGKVLRLVLSEDRVIVEGVNYVTKHLRRSSQHPHGARIQKEAPLHLSNVKVVCQACDKPTKVSIKTIEGGKRIRICKKCNQAIGSEK